MIWKQAPNAYLYLPYINEQGQEFGLLPDLLGRIAYQESAFNPDAVNKESGCRGLFQLNPVYYPKAGQNWQNDTIDAARLVAANYYRFQDWSLAVAAYDDGAGNIDMWQFGKRQLPDETRTYVREVNADVPIAGMLTLETT